jgi:AraC-like DNA-binding protein
VLKEYPNVPGGPIEKAQARYDVERLPVAVAQHLLRQLVALTGDPHLGLKAAQRTGVDGFQVLECVAASAATWRAAIESFLRYTRILNGAFDGRLEVRDGRAHIVLASRVELGRVSRDFQLALFFLKMARWQHPARPGFEVHFGYPRPAATSAHREVFGDASLVFGAPHDAFVMDARLLDTPQQSVDSSLHGVLRAHAEQLLMELAPGETCADGVRAQLLRLLPKHEASAERVARKLGMSRRTLTRQLEAEGTSFTELFSALRRQLAERYLQHTDDSVEDIAFQLGYSEASAFVRAFRRWNGRAPREYRRARAWRTSED